MSGGTTIHFTREEYACYRALAKQNSIQFSTTVRILALPLSIPNLFYIIKSWAGLNRKFAKLLHECTHAIIFGTEIKRNPVITKLLCILKTFSEKQIHTLHYYTVRKLGLHEVVIPSKKL